MFCRESHGVASLIIIQGLKNIHYHDCNKYRIFTLWRKKLNRGMILFCTYLDLKDISNQSALYLCTEVMGIQWLEAEVSYI